MADVGREALLAFDPVLDGVGHVVERAREAVQVGVGLLRSCGVSRPPDARFDAASATRRQRSEHPSAGRPSEERREQRGQDRADDQGGGEDPQGALGRVERERLEIRRRRSLHPERDADVRVAVDGVEALEAGEAVVRRSRPGRSGSC